MSSSRAAQPTALSPTATPCVRRYFLAPVILIAAFVLMNLLDKRFPGAIWFTMPWKMLGWLPILLGCGFCLCGALQFARQHTTLLPFHASRTLVTTGVFRVSRNPMYLGMTLVLVGLAVTAGSATVWIVPPLFVLAIDLLLIRAEEAMLVERFGDDYDRYRRRVRRWV